MPVTLRREGADAFRLDISGVLRKADLDRAQDQFIEQMRVSGANAVRLLVVLDAFEGWEPGAGGTISRSTSITATLSDVLPSSETSAGADTP